MLHCLSKKESKTQNWFKKIQLKSFILFCKSGNRYRERNQALFVTCFTVDFRMNAFTPDKIKDKKLIHFPYIIKLSGFSTPQSCLLMFNSNHELKILTLAIFYGFLRPNDISYCGCFLFWKTSTSQNIWFSFKNKMIRLQKCVHF